MSRQHTKCDAKLLAAVLFACWVTTGCASVDTYSNRLAKGPVKLSPMSIWSGVGRVSYQSMHVPGEQPFKDSFKLALLGALKKQGITASIQDATSLPKLTQAERTALISHEDAADATRLVIQVNSVTSMANSKDYWIGRAIYGLSLYSIKDETPLWQAEVAIDVGVGASKWDQKTAEQFAENIVQLLRKDGLLEMQ